MDDQIRNYEIAYVKLWRGIRVGQQLTTQVEAVDVFQARDIFDDDQDDNDVEVLTVTCTD